MALFTGRRQLLPAILGALVGSSLVTGGPARSASSGLARPIEPPAAPLPPEAESAGVVRFSFVAYGDTRSKVDGSALQPDHGDLVDRIQDYVKVHASGVFPVKFVLQSGDAVTRGSETEQWDVSFSPLIGRLTRDAGLPYFFAVGNHDEPAQARSLGLGNVLAAMSKLIPPEGSPRRLNGYPTYAFGFGNLFAIAIDSNIAADMTQLAWVTDQLEHLDRRRYRHVLAFFHHPIFSSGPHGGSAPGPSSQTMAEDSVEPQTAALRRLYAPLFRRFHVRLTLSGHDHLLDHFIERYKDGGESYRRDDIVSGGGGAPIYTYRGEPDLTAYLASAASQAVQVTHVMRPGARAPENPHHVLIVRVDGDRLHLEVVGQGPEDYLPFEGRSQLDLNDP
jgi:hypothetical protein